MRFLNFLISRAPTPESEPPTSLPPINLSGLTPISSAHGAEVTEAETAEVSNPTLAFPFDLADVYTVIEYTDADGDRTLRRVTLRRIKETVGGLLVFGICHERRSPRSFNVDRIRAIADEHGELLPFPVWFEQTFGLHLDPVTDVFYQIKAIKDEIRPALVLLVASAQADNRTLPIELDVIHQYIETEALKLKQQGILAVAFTERMARLFDQTVRRMNPHQDAIHRACAAISEWSPPRQARLYRAITRVIAADMVIHPDELEFVNELNELREQHDH